MHKHTASRFVNKPGPREELSRRFADQVEAALAPVVSCDIYLDSLQVLLRRWLSRETLDQLWRHNNEQLISESTKAYSYPARILLHQPTTKTLKDLAQVAPDALVNRIDVALDLTVKTREDADELGDFVRHHVTQRWRGRRQVTQKVTTAYYGPASTNRNVVLYADKPSKVTGGPALHLEVRYYSADACKRIGVKHLSDLNDFDAISVINRSCRLSALIWSKVDRNITALAGKAILARNRRRQEPMSRSRMDSRLRGLLSAQLQDGDVEYDLEDVPVQLWIDRNRHLVSNALVNLSFVECLGEAARMIKSRDLTIRQIAIDSKEEFLQGGPD